MVLKMIWNNVSLYKSFELDIWGSSILGLLGNTKIGKMFNSWDIERIEFKSMRNMRYIYSIDLDKPASRSNSQNWWFVRRRLSSLFYLTLSYAQFRNLAYVASNNEGSWESSFIMLVENSVLGMLYSMQVNLNVFELSWFVLLGNVYVNNNNVTYYNAAVHYFEIMTFTENTSYFLRLNIIERFNSRSMYFGIPSYLFVSYKHMFAFVFNEPNRSHLVFPIKAIDVYSSADYY